MIGGLAAIALAGAAEPPGEVPSAERVRVQLHTSFLVADKSGVPDANRVGVNTGLTVWRKGRVGLAVEPSVVLGYSEMERWSVRLGANLEAERHFPKARTSTYVSTGLHWFRSFTEPETRVGLLWRAAVGLRLATGGSGFLGVEPLAIERFPNGEGVMTPLRSRWGYEFTFIAAGFRL